MSPASQPHQPHPASPTASQERRRCRRRTDRTVCSMPCAPPREPGAHQPLGSTLSGQCPTAMWPTVCFRPRTPGPAAPRAVRPWEAPAAGNPSLMRAVLPMGSNLSPAASRRCHPPVARSVPPPGLGPPSAWLRTVAAAIPHRACLSPATLCSVIGTHHVADFGHDLVTIPNQTGRECGEEKDTQST